MRLKLTGRIEPVLVSGNGIPFDPRTMWAVVVTVADDSDRFAGFAPPHRPAYWSRRVAERMVVEHVREMESFTRDVLAQMRPGL